MQSLSIRVQTTIYPADLIAAGAKLPEAAAMRAALVAAGIELEAPLSLCNIYEVPRLKPPYHIFIDPVSNGIHIT